ncbi:MAG: ROK family protein, partial [Planctomycetes bacterium]|nr:ROK family protein [Planctomycetota bacterium]
PISRAEIATITGLDRKSITNFVNEFLEIGLVHEIGTRLNDRGPSSTLLEIIPNSRYCIGIALRGDHAAGVAIALPGVIGEVVRYRYPDFTAAGVAHTVKRLVDTLWPSSSARVCGVGVSLPAGIQASTAMVRRSINLPQLNGLRLPEVLRSERGCPFFFENSARAKALAEKWFGLGMEKSHFACVDLSVGVGCGIIHNRRLFLSPGDFTGEIGHLVIEPFGNQCGCGNQGCLEAYVGERALFTAFSNAGCLDEAGVLMPDHPAAQEIFSLVGQWLGRGLAPLVNVLNPSSIIINGSVTQYAEASLPTLWKTLRQYSLSDCWSNLEILFSSMPDSDAVGAACIPLSTVFEAPGYYYT